MKKKFGQHFLTDELIINKIIDSAKINFDDILIEIGPGNGALTNKLHTLVKKLILVEYDEKYYNIIKNRYIDASLEIYHEDARNFDYSKITNNKKNYSIIGNLPYYASNPIIRNILRQKNKPKKMTFMIQKEVAEQICAKEGKFSFLSAYINLFSNAKIIFDVSPKSFNPVPKVVSSVIEIQPLEKNILANSEIDAFIEFLTFGFKSPRKQIHNSLSDGLFLKLDCSKKIIEKAEIETTRRPSTLTIFEWKKLFHIWLDFDSPKNTPGSIRRK